MIVVDASFVLDLLLDQARAEPIRAALFPRAPAIHAPHLLDVEVAQTLRRLALAGALTASRAALALDDLVMFPMTRHPHTALIAEVFALRANMTAYDATYVCLARALDAELWTCDAALGRAPGVAGIVRVFS